jgi:hypothetical protein
MAFMIIAQDGRIIHQIRDLPTDGGGWILPNLLPDRYTLGIGSPAGMFQFIFADGGDQPFRRPLDVPSGDGDVHEYTFKIKPFEAKAK